MRLVWEVELGEETSNIGTVGVFFSQSEFIEGQLYAYPKTRPFCKREERLCMGGEVIEEVREARTHALRSSHPGPPHCIPGATKKN